MQNSAPGLVSIIIPTLNEEASIGATVTSLAGQLPSLVKEILIVDGGSTDRTRAIVNQLAANDDRIRLVENPARLQAAGFNLAARMTSSLSEYLVRADAHAVYGSDYVESLVSAAQASGAQSVVNRLRSEGTNCFQKAVGYASNGKLGTGGAIHRVGGTSGFVDHGHHALFRRNWFLDLGGYDESFAANEDAEFDVRLRSAGGRIWYTDEATIGYICRSSPRALWLQYWRYGQGRARNQLKHGQKLRLRQLAPPILVILVALSLLTAVVLPAFLLLPILYITVVVAGSIQLCSSCRDRCALGAIFAIPIMHIAWGSAFLLVQIKGRTARFFEALGV